MCIPGRPTRPSLSSGIGVKPSGRRVKPRKVSVASRAPACQVTPEPGDPRAFDMHDLSPALDAQTFEIDSPRAGRIFVYVAGEGPPLLLIHSVNAAGSAYEVKPIFEHLRATRRVYAMDLPGFGRSERSAREYTPRVMTNAVAAVCEAIRERDGDGPIDALAVSLGAEFLARAAHEDPGDFRTVALVSPTGLEGTRRDGAPGTNRGMSWVRAVVSCRLWDDGLFGLLIRPGVIRYFLEKTFGRRQIDEGLFAYDVETTRQPGAKHAPLAFISGYLFSADISRIYESLEMPVWVGHGVRGDFVKFDGAADLAGRPNWTVRSFETGALPHFEVIDAFMEHYEDFLE